MLGGSLKRSGEGKPITEDEISWIIFGLFFLDFCSSLSLCKFLFEDLKIASNLLLGSKCSKTSNFLSVGTIPKFFE